MKKEHNLLFTAGRGPIECQLAVHGIQNRFKEYLTKNKIPFEIIIQKKGNLNKSMETIVFKVLTTEEKWITPWLGTIQWVCKSPVRKFHKRKNWFIKCQEINLHQPITIDQSKVLIQSYRASGPGGQHRNKVETAIRIIHKSSGIIVTASDGKSQAQNKKKAWQKLEDKLKTMNTQNQKAINLDQWIAQIEIERGNPIKTFRGLKFEIK